MKTRNQPMSLEQSTYQDKAVLLHQLFPQEIPHFIEFTESLCLTIQEDQSINRSAWDNNRLSFEQWMVLVEDVKSEIAFYRTAIIKSPFVFAKMLFSLDRPFVMDYSLKLYTQVRTSKDGKFSQIASIFFDQPIAHWKDLPKVAEAEKPEYIFCDEHSQYSWVCICGNLAEDEGFYPCDSKGDQIEPADEWDDLNVCMNCGRFFDQKNMQVVGINPNPKWLDFGELP